LTRRRLAKLWPDKRWQRVLVVVGTLIIVVVVAIGIDALVLYNRISRVAVTFPTTQEGTTWVILGSNSRAAVPPGPNYYGSVQQSPGAHVDAIVVIHQEPTRTTIMSVPRDVLVSPAPGEISRLALTYTQGPQQVINGLCRSLNIPATHLAVVTMKGFAAAVDDLGGVTITSATPVRDLMSGLDITKAGSNHLDGIQALALVRSREPQTLTSRGWVPSTASNGDMQRTRWLGDVAHLLADKAWGDRFNPFVMQSLAWDLTGSLTLDNGTSVLSFIGLDLTGAHIVDVPVQYLGTNGIGAAPDASTMSAIATAGFTGRCQVG
jgi:LCP family protein required for cell wall assembly